MIERKIDTKTEPKRKRLIELPERVWAVLDADARRSRRTSMKQLQAIIETVYGLGDVELGDTSAASSIVSFGRGSLAGERPIEVDQGLLFSTGTNEQASKKASRKQKLDEEDVRRDARERSRKKKQSGL
jgi:hypothetical protein